MIVIIIICIFKMCLANETEVYKRDLPSPQLLNMTIVHAEKLLDRVSEMVTIVRKRLLTINISDTSRSNEVYPVLTDGLKYLYELQLRVSYCIHMLTTSILLREGETLGPKDLTTKTFKTKGTGRTTTMALIRGDTFFTDNLLIIAEHAVTQGPDECYSIMGCWVSFIEEIRPSLYGRMADFLLSILPPQDDVDAFRERAKECVYRIKALPEFLQRANEGINRDGDNHGRKLRQAAITYLNFTASETTCYDILDKVMLPFFNAMEWAHREGRWRSFKSDCKKLIPSHFDNRRRSGPATSSDIRGGYLTEALLRLTTSIQKKDNADLISVLKHYNVVMLEYVKKYDLRNTILEMYLKDRLALTEPNLVKLFAKLYHDDIEESDYEVIQKGDEALRKNDTLGKDLLNTVDQFERYHTGGDKADREMCSKIIGKMLRTFMGVQLAGGKKLANLRINRGKPSQTDLQALVYLQQSLRKFEQDILYIEYILNFNIVKTD